MDAADEVGEGNRSWLKDGRKRKRNGMTEEDDGRTTSRDRLKRMKDGKRGWCWVVGMPNLSSCCTGAGLVFRAIRPLIATFSYSFTRV
ncbi:hypothetical protein GB937_004878 [Aspergillus fischeri]|nr:hypothetical protein GB937_004878 [Aspergillus fischeri]